MPKEWSQQTFEDERMEHPVGVPGLMLSFSKVCEMAKKGMRHASTRRWVTHTLRDAGDPQTTMGRIQAIYDAFCKQFIWVPDPDHTEQMVGSHLLLDDIMAGGDCFAEGTLMLAHGHGVVTVETLRPGVRIWGLDRWSEVQAVTPKGVLWVDLVKLHNGSALRLTGDHHVYVLDCIKHPLLSDDEEPIHLFNNRCECDIDETREKRCRVSELAIGMILSCPSRDYDEQLFSRFNGYRDGLPKRVVALERDTEKVKCWDIQTDDHRVYLPEHDVTVSQCDDLALTLAACIACLAMMLENINVRVAVVGHAYNGGDYGHVLIAIWDNGKWLCLDPSTKKPIGVMVGNVTKDIMFDVMTGEIICEGACMIKGKTGPKPKPLTTAGVFQAINGVEVDDAVFERIESKMMERLSSLPNDMLGAPVAMGSPDDWQAAWREHVELTRAYLLTRVIMGPEAATEGSLPRLMANQDRLGALFNIVSKGSGPAVAKLLKEHIVTAGALIEALLADYAAMSRGAVTMTAVRPTQKAVENATAAWYANADKIAKALAQLKAFGSYDMLRKMMQEHLNATGSEVTATIVGDQAASEKWYQQALWQVAQMAASFTQTVVGE